MLLGRAMLPYRSAPRATSRARTTTTGTRVVAVGCAALLTASVSACSSAQKMTTSLKVRNSVAKLSDQTAASAVASVDGTTDHTYAFLRHAGAHVTRADATRVARAEVTMAATSGSDTTSLRDVPRTEGLNVAGSLNFGGTDVVAVKSIDDTCYLRLRLDRLVAQGGGSGAQQRTADRIMALADHLPTTLGAAKDALKGRWVRADPSAFGDFARAAETLSERTAYDKKSAKDAHDAKKRAHEADRKAGRIEEARKDRQGRQDGQGSEDGRGDGNDAKPAKPGKAAQDRADRKAARTHEDATRAARALRDLESRRASVHAKSRRLRQAAAVGSALDGQSQREFIAGVQKLLGSHAKFTLEETGGGRGNRTERVRMTLSGRQAAGDLSAASKALGIHLDPQQVPDRDISAELLLRRGQLASLTVDLGQFTEGHGAGAGKGEDHHADHGEGHGADHGDGAAARHLPLRLEFSSGQAVPVEAPGGTRKLNPQDLLAAGLYGALGTRNF